MKPIPVILFAYARPRHLERTLHSLRQNRVPFIYAFSDGAASADKTDAVNEVRELLHRIDWCETSITERPLNLGLGRSIIAGTSQVLREHESAIVFEDDLVCVPGTYDYLSAALNQYRNDSRVMSVTGWTHPLITPDHVKDLPYFDGRAECWVWGTWARSWEGMETPAHSIMLQCKARGIDVYRYGSDLVAMAESELEKNIWAVRFVFLHIFRQSLCLRPPWTMVEHIGFDAEATNTVYESWLKNEALRPAPSIPKLWPEAIESLECAALHRAAADGVPASPSVAGYLTAALGALKQRLFTRR